MVSTPAALFRTASVPTTSNETPNLLVKVYLKLGLAGWAVMVLNGVRWILFLGRTMFSHNKWWANPIRPQLDGRRKIGQRSRFSGKAFRSQGGRDVARRRSKVALHQTPADKCAVHHLIHLMLSSGSIRLFAAVLLLAVVWQAWRSQTASPVMPKAGPVPAAASPGRERSLFPDE